MRIVAPIAAVLLSACAAASAPGAPAAPEPSVSATPGATSAAARPTVTSSLLASPTATAATSATVGPSPTSAAGTAAPTASAAPTVSAAAATPTPVSSAPSTVVVATIAPSAAGAVANAPCGNPTTSTLSSASGPIAKTNTTSCYNVAGSSAQEIRVNINASPARPKDQNSGTATDANTAYTFNFRWTTAAAVGGCRATTVSAAFGVEFTYPRWVAPPSPPALLVSQWNAYVAALQAHESGHELNGIDATNDAYAAIKALSVASCADFNAAAEAAIHAASARSKQADVSYDATTNHGATQGARFP